MNFICAVRLPGNKAKALYHVNDAADFADARAAALQSTDPRATVLLCLRGKWPTPPTNPMTPEAA